MLYMTTGMLDRHDQDHAGNAICKVFCSAMGWEWSRRHADMGGEGYMTENEIERILRDSRINLIVEGANEVMQAFIFGYAASGWPKACWPCACLRLETTQSAWKNMKRLAGNLFRRPSSALPPHWDGTVPRRQAETSRIDRSAGPTAAR